jgi:adenine phosphoribosyltransferase
MTTESLQKVIRTVPDWPVKGVQFRDITPLLQDGATFRELIYLFAERYRGKQLDYVAGIDARGFIIGSALAYELNIGFLPVRKQGKLPYATVCESYALEYGKASIEIHVDACCRGDRVVLVDDLVATGGTLLAAHKLIRRVGGEVVEAAAIVDLPDLGGSRLLQEKGLPLYTLCHFSGE